MHSLIALLPLVTLAQAGHTHTLLTRANTCKVQPSLDTTFYGWPDNDPPSATTAWGCLGRGTIAGGTGTYDDPVTFAAALEEYARCEILYSPYLHKYLIYQDECATCEPGHIDIWTGSNKKSGGQAQVKCEDALTPDSGTDYVRYPPQDLIVESKQLFVDGTCDKDAVFEGEKGSCSGGGDGDGEGGVENYGDLD